MNIKAKWAGKLLRSKHFVVLTDKESVVCLRGVNPDNINDFVVLTAQAAELEAFAEGLKDLIAKHDVAVRKLSGLKPRSKSVPKKNTTIKRKKIPVKNG